MAPSLRKKLCHPQEDTTNIDPTMQIQKKNQQSVSLRSPLSSKKVFCTLRRLVILVAIGAFFSFFVFDSDDVDSVKVKSTRGAAKRDELSVKLESDVETLIDEKQENNNGALEEPAVEIDDQNAESKKEKPRLFLLVGPQKAGFGAIRSMFDMVGHKSGSLPGDNWDYEYINPQGHHFDCTTNEWGGFTDCSASEKLLTRIENSRKDGKNLFLADDNLDRSFIDILRGIINDEDWDVTVIVMYRRFHEWLLSWYNLIEKTTNLDAEGNTLFDENGIPYRKEHTEWPDHGGARIPTFTSWYKEYTKFWFYTPRLLHKQHRSIGWYMHYKKSFDNVLLYNIYKQPREQLLEDFFCNILKAENACEQIQNKVYPQPDISDPVNLRFDILSVNAYEKGLIPKSATRQEVVKAVENYIKETHKSLPGNCDSVMIDQLRSMFFKTEKIVVGEDNWSDARESELSDIFSSFVAKGQICNVDTEAVFADEEWISFFESLDTSASA